MKILQICNKPPFPAVDGGAIAMNNTTQGLLQNGHKVTVLAITTPKHPVHLSDLPEQYISILIFNLYTLIQVFVCEMLFLTCLRKSHTTLSVSLVLPSTAPSKNAKRNIF